MLGGLIDVQYELVVIAILAALLIPAALFDRRRRRAGRAPSDGLRADRRRREIMYDTETVMSETMNHNRAGRGGGGGF